MIRSLGDKTPKVAETAWVSEFAYVVGDVEIGEYSSIWPGVTIRGDGQKSIKIGDYVNAQEGAVIHGSGLVVEDYVTIGHAVVVHGDFIGEGCLLGNNCTFLHRSSLGKRCLIGANSVVLAGTNIPDNSFVTGVPGEIKREVSEAQIEDMKHTAMSLVEHAKEFKANGL